MPDFSIGNSFSSEQPKNAGSHKSEFTKAEREYVDFRIKMQKSDFANSSSAIKMEQKLLSKMKEAAQKEGLEQKLAEIEEREEQLKSLNKPASAEFVPYYKPISFSGEAKLKGSQNETVKNIEDAFSDAEDEHKEYLIKTLTSDGTIPISKSVSEAMQRIGKMGCHPNLALAFYEKFAKSSGKEDEPKVIDLSLVDRFSKLRNKNIDDSDAIKVLALFNDNYENKEMLNSAINVLADEKVSPQKIIQIVSALSVAKEDGKLLISVDAANSVASIKNMLRITNAVEEREQKNPINLLNTYEIPLGKEILVIKNNKVVASYEKSTNSKQNYEDYISDKQDDIMLEFAEEYSDKQGEIPLNALRVMTSLRRNNVAMDSLIQLMDFCYKDGKINKINLHAVRNIKKAGALSHDVKTILSSLKKDKEGNYDLEDMKNAQLLTKACIDGSNVAVLIPLVRDSENTLDLTTYLSQFTQIKSNIVDLIKLTKKKDGTTSDNSIEIITNLARNFWETDEKPMPEIDFVLNAKSILNAAFDPIEKGPTDASAGICAIMCQNKESPENILRGLNICKNQDGAFDDNLADILWNMSLDNSNINEIEQLIVKCKNDKGEVNQELTNKILDLYKKGIKTQQILEMVLKTG